MTPNEYGCFDSEEDVLEYHFSATTTALVSRLHSLVAAPEFEGPALPIVDRGGDLLTYPSPRFPAGLSEVTGVSTGRGGPSDRGVCERHDFRV
eukprot:CAMPEP_0178769042 /NCGR_PEP_ID=MMETSP0744-20121128/20599_1 /TAXON_ID=913974 /ORGANISM="Nitzschia punctata, Strain CCMP561" /LENGTH=92 /DNA_ID=CAMNT_0020425229 /DNA_START=383 /DNA_END=657 /DNA_ORIENTATION=+